MATVAGSWRHRLVIFIREMLVDMANVIEKQMRTSIVGIARESWMAVAETIEFNLVTSDAIGVAKSSNIVIAAVMLSVATTALQSLTPDPRVAHHRASHLYG